MKDSNKGYSVGVVTVKGKWLAYRSGFNNKYDAMEEGKKLAGLIKRDPEWRNIYQVNPFNDDMPEMFLEH